MLNAISCARWRPIVECDFEQDGLHNDHEACLNKQGGVIVRSEPVEDFQYRCNKHDKRDVEGEAIAGLVAMNGQDLVGVGCNWRCDETDGC